MRVGIVGAGGMGRVHASKYALMPEVGLHVYSLMAEAAGKLAATHGGKVHDTMEHMLAEVDCVDVCVPTDHHAKVAIQCLEAGKPTLVEKPMARTLEDCDAMIAASRKSGAGLMVGQVVRWFPEHRRAHNVIASGGIGDPASVRLRRGGKAPQGEDMWFQDFSRSGGVLLDLAIHEFDWLLWTLGPAKTVMSRSVRQGETVAGAEFEGDYALTTITHANGCVSHVESTWLDPSGFRVTLEAAGSKGVLEWDSRQNPTLRTHTGAGSRNENLMAASDDPYFRQLSAFLAAAKDGGPMPVSGEEGRAAMQVALAALESAQTGQPVHFA